MLTQNDAILLQWKENWKKENNKGKNNRIIFPN